MMEKNKGITIIINTYNFHLSFSNFTLFKSIIFTLWRHSGLMVSGLNPRLSGLGLSPGQGQCVVFLGKTLYSHSSSLHPSVQMGTAQFNVGGNPAID